MKLRRSKFSALSIVTSLVLLSTQAFALVITQPFVISNPTLVAKNAEKLLDPKSFRNEHLFIEETLNEYFRKAHPGEKFRGENYRKAVDELADSSLHQSWRDEVAILLDGQKIPSKIYLNPGEDLYQHFYRNSSIAIAKQVAKTEMYETVQKNWPKLKDTVFNDKDINCSNVINNKCTGFNEVMAQSLRDDFFFSYPLTTHFNDNNYVFEFQGVGYVTINRSSLKVGRVVIGIDYLNDLNRVVPGTENYRTDVEAGIAPPPPPPTASPAGSNGDTANP